METTCAPSDCMNGVENIDGLEKHVFNTDPELPRDLLNYRTQDFRSLLRRLDAVVKQHLLRRQEELTEETVKGLVQSLVHICINTVYSIKLSRAVEKLWQPYMVKYPSCVFLCLEDHVMHIIRSNQTDHQVLAKISVLLEQNRTVQQIFKKHLARVTSWIAQQLSPLLKLSPQSLTVIQSQCLQSVVKICLQNFQVCPSELGSIIWRPISVVQPEQTQWVHDDQSRRHISVDQPDQSWCVQDDQSTQYQSVKVIVEALVHILTTQGYQTDCVLLCGTAVALMLNTTTNYSQAACTFYWILSSVLGSDIKFNCSVVSQSKSMINTSVEEANREKLGKLKADQLGAVALIRGIVACGSVEFLFSPYPYGDREISSLDKDSQNDTDNQNVRVSENDRESKNDNAIGQSYCEETFRVLFDYIHILCLGDITLHYQSFQVLQFWYSRLTKITSTEESTLFTHNATFILKRSLHLVMLNWDSPIEDVPEAVVEIFAHMMSMWVKCRTQLEEWPQQILTALMKTHWYIKGKYRILAVILKYIDSNKVLQDYPEMGSQLLQCLATNHLASSATNVYKAFLHEIQIKDKMKSLESWKAQWLDLVVNGLVSNNSLLRCNMSLYWVPATFKLLPLSAGCLQGHLSALIDSGDSVVCRTRLLHAWVVVAKTVRTLTGTANLTDGHVCEALYSADEDLRSEAIALVCITLKEADCISAVEVSLLQGCLPHNIKIDSAAFRQLIVSNIHKLLVRLRDSCIALLKDTDKNKAKLDCALDFVDWLHRLCIDNLLPGACYQRRKGSLDLLHIIYECLVYCPDRKQRKGRCTPESSAKLVDFAMVTGRWAFFSRENTNSLILCVLDGTDEIQSSACHLLTKYYNWSLEDNMSTHDCMCCHLLAESLRLCNSPKGHESQSGSVLCKLVFQKYAIENNVGFDFILDEDGNQYRVSATRNQDNSAVHFLTCLLRETRRCITEADKNLVLASKQYPVHGLIAAITRCLTETEDLWVKPDKRMLHVVEEVISTCQEIIDNMLSIMASVAGKEACPSFAEIGQALEMLLQENQPEYTETTSLSPEYQYMLSWCWNNIKESCSSLGELTWTVLMSGCTLPLSKIQNISNTFLTVLTKCRHKGVIEGSRSAFVKFCSALFSSGEDQLHKLPADILSQVLSRLKSNVMSSSATRRSAGLPVIIQAILVSEKKIKKTTLLNEAISSLFETCVIPLDNDIGVVDLPQVHGLNILYSVFSDATLSASLVGHVGHAVIMVIQQFGSPSWAVRNAATRLFSTLVTRIFGQRKAEDMLCNSITFQEFSSYYPELPPFLLDILCKASERDVKDISQIHPGLFPSLTLLSSLKPLEVQDDTLKGTIELFADRLQVFTGSPVYQLRHLVAPALVAMVNMADMRSDAEKCIQTHITDDSQLDFNSLHGYLLFVYRLLDYIDSVEDLETMWQLLRKKCWLMSSKICLVSGQYVQILHRLVQKHGGLVVDSAFIDSLTASCCDTGVHYIGGGIYSEEAVSFLFTLHNQSGKGLAELIEKLLSSANQDTRWACLQKLQSWTDLVLYCPEKLMNIMCVQLQNDTYVPNMCMIFELISRLHVNTGTVPPDDLDHIEDWFLHYSQLLQQFTSLSASALPVQAILVKEVINNSQDRLEDKGKVEEWCHLVQYNSQVTNGTLRLSAARALQVAGDMVLTWSHVHKSADIGPSAVSLISACVTLIQDEDTAIRSEACKFVSNLQWKGKPVQYTSIHSNVCFELLLEYVGSNFWWSPECVDYLTTQLYSPGDLVSVMQDRSTTRFQQLFDQEDNSFFAERLYNAVCFHSCLKDVVKRCHDSGSGLSLGRLNHYGAVIHEDLQVLVQTLANITKGSIINLCCDSVILASMCSLLLVSDLVALVNAEPSSLRTQITAILKTNAFPGAALQKLII